jgi:phosphatidylglycerol---prolipoprotein diacylglyceryl transferase
MSDIIYDDGFFLIPSWHFVFVVAAIAAITYYFILLLKFNHPINKHSTFIPLLIYFTGYFGAKLGKDFYNLKFLLTPTPMVFYLGASCAFFTFYIYCKLFKIKTKEQIDILAPPILLGSSIGRIGCFLNHDDYGIINNYFALNFFPRIPSQLLESLILGICAIFIPFVYYKKYRLFPGKLGTVCLLTHSLVRICIEFIRDDPRLFVFKNTVSVHQLTAIIISSLCILELKKISNKTDNNRHIRKLRSLQQNQ